MTINLNAESEIVKESPRLREDTLARVQYEIGSWAIQFGDNESQDPLYNGAKLFSIPPFLGMVEEIGELAAVSCKRHQGRKFQDDQEAHAAKKDGVADLLIFACDWANREGIDLASTLRAVWETVKQRSQGTWEADKAKETTLGGEDISPQSSPKSTDAATQENDLINEIQIKVRSAKLSPNDPNLDEETVKRIPEARAWLSKTGEAWGLSVYKFDSWDEVGEALLERITSESEEQPIQTQPSPKEPLDHIPKVWIDPDKLPIEEGSEALCTECGQPSVFSSGIWTHQFVTPPDSAVDVRAIRRRQNPLTRSYNRRCAHDHCDNKVHSSSSSPYCANCSRPSTV